MENNKPQNFQECAQLEIENVYAQGKTSLADLMNLQKTLQEELFGHNFEQVREKIGSLKQFVDWNEEAIRDEMREFANALTGIHTYPNCWKPWKSKHKEAMNRSFNDLTAEEKLELQYEWIDQLHFFFNIGLAIDMTPEKTINMYYAKNKENIARQKKGNY